MKSVDINDSIAFDEVDDAISIDSFFLGDLPNPNIAGYFSDKTLDAIAMRVCDKYEVDLESIQNDIDEGKKYLDMLSGKRIAKNYPFPNASNVIYPIFLAAVNKFAATMSPAVLNGGDVVKAEVKGVDETIALDEQGNETAQSLGKADKAVRITTDMNHQFMVEDENWEADTDAGLRFMAALGGFWRKRYYDNSTMTNRSAVFKQHEVVVNANSPRDVSRIPAISYEFALFKHEVIERVRDGRFLDLDFVAEDDHDEEFSFVEQFRYEDLDGDGIGEPYYVTVHRERQKVVRIFPAYFPNEIRRNDRDEIISFDVNKCWIYYPFMPDPTGGFYGWGLGNILYQSNAIINSVFNQLLDAGHLANSSGGFIGGGLRLGSGVMRMTPGEWKQVSADGQAISQNIVPMNFKEPSMVLFQLLGQMVQYTKDLANMRDVLSGEVPTNTPATTTIAMIEQGLIEFKDIFKRIHRSLKKEAAYVFFYSRLYRTDEQYREALANPSVSANDYRGDGIEVIPQTDPSVISNVQKMTRVGLLEAYKDDPFVDPVKIRRKIFDSAGIDDSADFIVEPQPPLPPPPDPLMEANLQLVRTQIEKLNADMLQNQQKMDLDIAKTEADVQHKQAQSLKVGAEAINEIGLAEQKEPNTQDLNEYLAILRDIKAMIDSGQLPTIQRGLDAATNPNTPPMGGMAQQPANAGAIQIPEQ